jgi:hypothetical protein
MSNAEAGGKSAFVVGFPPGLIPHWTTLTYASPDRRDVELYRQMVEPEDARGLMRWSPSLLRETLDSVPVSPKVDEEVRKLIERVGKVYMYAYLEYEFFDVAVQLALVVMETTLRIKLDRPFRKGEHSSLGELVNVAVGQNLLPNRWSGKTLGNILALRNHYAHAGGKNVLNYPLAAEVYAWLVDMSNCLYDEDWRAKEPEHIRRKRQFLEQCRTDYANAAGNRGPLPGSEVN